MQQEMMIFTQGSKEWLDWRSRGIGASDAPVICGVSPWKEVRELWLEKTGQVDPPDLSQNFAIVRGNRVEPIVRGMWEDKTSKTWVTALFEHDKYSFLGASLDGWDEADEGLEIKVPGYDTHYAPEVKDAYWVQCQQQMACAGLRRLHYVSYYLKKGVEEHQGEIRSIIVTPCQAFLDQYFRRAELFWQCVSEKRDPAEMMSEFAPMDLRELKKGTMELSEGWAYVQDQN